MLNNAAVKAITRHAAALLLVPAITHGANQVDESLKRNFWSTLYKDGGRTFYCDKPFSGRSAVLTESYIYAKSWVRDHLDCGTMRQCEQDHTRFIEISTDLHNIVVTSLQTEYKMKNTVFGLLDGQVQENECGIRKHMHIVEPPDSRKGDVARIMFYMHDRYQLPLVSSQPDLIRWSEIDPPSPEEIERDRKIEAIQGNGNRFVSNPEQIYELRP
jgi:deoxyribonuclease-1